MKKSISIILCLIMLATIVPISVISFNAVMADEAFNCELGVECSGAWGGTLYSKYYRFYLPNKSHVSFFSKSNYKYTEWNFYSSSGNIVWKSEDVVSKGSYNSATGYYTINNGLNLNKGTYYLEVYGNFDIKYSFIIDAENTIKLSKGVLNSVKSNKKSKFTASCKQVENAIGYQFQYSLSETFKKKTKKVNSADTKKTVSKLKKGKRYYVRVRPYTIYTDGTYVYGQYSLPKSVKIKK